MNSPPPPRAPSSLKQQPIGDAQAVEAAREMAPAGTDPVDEVCDGVGTLTKTGTRSPPPPLFFF